MHNHLTEEERSSIETIFALLDVIAKTSEDKSFILGFITASAYMQKHEQKEAS